MDDKFYIEINCQQKNHNEERVCGDVFLSKRIKEEGRFIIVLSDGLGHGIKANLLAILTSTLAASFTEERQNISRIADTIMNTLPFDEVKKLNYSTFTIIEIEGDGEVKILEFENPRTIVFRQGRIFEPAWNVVELDSDKNPGREIMTTNFRAQKEDRIVFCTDGVVQSGLGSEAFPLGWGEEIFTRFVFDSIKEEQDISAVKLAGRVINKANLNDQFFPKDDMSCGVIYFREPRKMMICTGPPLEESTDHEYAQVLESFTGRKIICGASTADIISREWKKEIIDSNVITDPELPPVAHMEGVELITEGILTLSKVNEILKAYNQSTKLGKGPADEIVKLILDSDEIHFIAGTKINEAHQDPSLPVDLELRRTVVYRITRVLEEKFLKAVSMKFF
ncbi:MAG: SpoIIE family protein phosphatase [Bacteroidetes bacterium]|nr:SpoIIE family protein phosphatase [Bacteroidota bacterium]